MIYTSLLGMEIKHHFYADGACPDFLTVPSQATEEFLVNQHCVVKPNNNGVEIYLETDGHGNPAFAFGDTDTLNFELCLRNADFSLFTDFTNLPVGSSTDSSTSLQVTCPGVSDISAKIFANVAITRDFNQVTGERVEISFKAKPVRWLYYLLTQTEDANTYQIVDGRDAPQFTWALAEGSDPVAVQLAARSPGLQVSRFLSGQTIPCQQLGIPKIQLMRQETQGASTLLIDNLPNPYYTHFLQTDDVEAAGKKVDALYHVLTFLNTTP